jgi:hypothetical protein
MILDFVINSLLIKKLRRLKGYTKETKEVFEKYETSTSFSKSPSNTVYSGKEINKFNILPESVKLTDF